MRVVEEDKVGVAVLGRREDDVALVRVLERPRVLVAHAAQPRKLRDFREIHCENNSQNEITQIHESKYVKKRTLGT